MDNEIEVPENVLVVTKTDVNGNILYANQAFISLTGYSEEEIIHKPHNFIRHPDMPALIFKLLWERLKKSLEIHLYVKNRAKSGSYYWVFSNIFPVKDMDETVIGYHSSRKKADPQALVEIEKLYSKFIELEKTGGIEASQNYLNSFLSDKKMDYDEFVLSI